MACLREFDTPFVARKEIDSQRLLELPDLPAQRRLRNVQALGCFAEIQILRHGNEVPDVTQFHGEAFYIPDDLWATGLCSPRANLRGYCPGLIPDMYQAKTK